MSDDDALIELMLKADECRLQGRPVAAEELCPDRPELWPALRELTDRVNRIDRLLGVDDVLSAMQPTEDVAVIHEAIAQLAVEDPTAAELVRLVHFGGMTLPKAAVVLGIPPEKCKRDWAYARAWLFRRLNKDHLGSS